MSLKIYNTAKREKEDFVPLVPGLVKMYVCGPTVYGLLHVGNFRGPIFFNLVRNWLERSGFKVEFVYNYTDVDDRIINKAVAEGRTAEEISTQYIAEFEKDFASMGLRPHTANPKVTDHLPSIVKMIGALVEKGTAYVVDDGEVLYSVRSFPSYGKLSGKNLDDLQAGARVEVDRKKRDPMDFALWKPAKPGEPKWTSPWCDGRPGWHIECSAMIQEIMGDSIDIHGGGSDLIFPHHENELAQSEGATGHAFVKYWMHNNMITFGDRKMSKSLGNITTARDFIAQYNAEICKYMMLSVHYRSLSDFSEQAVHFAIAGLARVYSALNLAESLLASAGAMAPGEKATKAFGEAVAAADKAVTDALNDDFNTSEMFAAIFSVVRAFNAQVRLGQKPTPEALKTAFVLKEWIADKAELLSLFREKPSDYLRLLDDMLLKQRGLERSKIQELVDARTAVRTAKDFKKSDELRDELVALGVALQDTPTGTFWEAAK